jgi:hypothetical protein
MYTVRVHKCRTCIGVLVLIILCSCNPAPDTAIYVTVSEKIPPSFSFSGPWWARDFQIIELDPHSIDRHTQDEGHVKKIWLITLGFNKGLRANKWPTITYGVTPDGFTQEIPAKDAPPPSLVEGKIYVAQVLDNAFNGGACHFMIRNGKPVEVPLEDVFKVEPASSNDAH